jgi:hypothetical protein
VDLPGATSSSLVLPNVQGADAGSYTVVVSNLAGEVTSQPAVLSVSGGQGAPVILVQPQDQTVPPSSQAVFSVTATGAAPLTYQWRFNRVAITGATGPTLTLNSAQPADAGNYSVIVSNPLGAVISQSATLTVATPPIRFTEARFIPNQGFRFTFAAPSAATYALEVSTDLKTWAELLTQVNTTGTLQFTDTEALLLPHSYYRVRRITP